MEYMAGIPLIIGKIQFELPQAEQERMQSLA
jgi:hypothetical protein